MEKTTECKYGTKTLNMTITDRNEWTSGNNSRTYLDITDTDKMFEVKSIYIDDSNTTELAAYDHEIETDSGRVIIECRDKMSGKKFDELKFAMYDLLDN